MLPTGYPLSMRKAYSAVMFVREIITICKNDINLFLNKGLLFLLCCFDVCEPRSIGSGNEVALKNVGQKTKKVLQSGE